MNVLQYLGTKRANMRKLVKPTGKMLWMSEFGCGSSPPSDMGAALELSAMILRVRNTQKHSQGIDMTYLHFLRSGQMLENYEDPDGCGGL